MSLGDMEGGGGAMCVTGGALGGLSVSWGAPWVSWGRRGPGGALGASSGGLIDVIREDMGGSYVWYCRGPGGLWVSWGVPWVSWGGGLGGAMGVLRCPMDVVRGGRVLGGGGEMGVTAGDMGGLMCVVRVGPGGDMGVVGGGLWVLCGGRVKGVL